MNNKEEKMNLDTVTETNERVEISPRMIGVNARKSRSKLNTSDKTQKSEYYYRTVENKIQVMRGFYADNLKFSIGE